MGQPASFSVCGGTLVSPRHVLTAAHCLPAMSEQPAVTLGAHNRCLRRERGRVEMEVAHWTSHPRWRPSSAGGNDLHDVAVLTFRRPAPAAYRPAALPPAHPPTTGTLIEVSASGKEAASWQPEAVGREAMVAGFGERRAGDVASQPCVLNVASVRVLSREECAVSAVPSFYARQSSLLCAGRPGGGVDSCQGDSGGPLVVKESGKDTLIGIVAFGFGCGKPHTPGLYTRVVYYLPWIREQMEGTHPSSQHGSRARITAPSTSTTSKRPSTTTSSSTAQSSATQISSGAENSAVQEGFHPLETVDASNNLQGYYSASNWIPMYYAPDGTLVHVTGYNGMNNMQNNPGKLPSSGWEMWPSSWQNWPNWWESWPNWWESWPNWWQQEQWY